MSKEFFIHKEKSKYFNYVRAKFKRRLYEYLTDNCWGFKSLEELTSWFFNSTGSFDIEIIDYNVEYDFPENREYIKFDIQFAGDVVKLGHWISREEMKLSKKEWARIKTTHYECGWNWVKMENHSEWEVKYIHDDNYSLGNSPDTRWGAAHMAYKIGDKIERKK